MLSSASVVDAQKKFNSPYHYTFHQLLYGVLPGLALFFMLSRIDYAVWKKLSLLILFAALLLMILVLIPRFSVVLRGAQSWVSLGGVVFQPAEFLKLGLVIYLAAWFSGREDRLKNWAYGLAPFFVIVAFIGLLLVLQPDVGTLVVVSFIALGVYFLAGARVKYLLILAFIGMAVLTALVAVAPYRMDRITTFLHPANDLRGASYQLNQAFISIGSGGLWGVGFGKSTQKLGSFLPEPVGDSIFAIIAEELGFVGGIATLGLFVWLFMTLIFIARQAHDKFARLYTSGIMLWIMGQTLINVAAIAGVVPLTGLPLPFISYGSTALVSLLAGLGIVMNVARRTS